MECNKRPLIFTFSHDTIMQGVKQESSLFSIRKKDNEGNALFDELVFDEAYALKFKELFFDAQAEVTSACSAYLREVPVAPEYFDEQDFLQNRDFTLGLLVSSDFIPSLINVVDIKLKQFIVAYMMYRWLETKQSQDSLLYYERGYKVLQEAVRLLNRGRNIKRPGGLWF